MKTYIYLMVAALTMVSCGMETELDWELKKHPDMLVVEGAITSDTLQHYIHLTLSGSYYDSKEPRAVSEANVYVTTGDKVYTFTEKADNPGYYFSDEEFSGQPDKTYNLFIKLKNEINGVSEYKSTATMPLGMKLDSIECEIYEYPEFEFDDEDDDELEEKDTTYLAIYYFGDEPTSLTNYYMAKTYRNEAPLQDNAREFFYNETYKSTDKTHLAIYVRNAAQDDTISFRLYTISYNYYMYLNAIRSINQTGMAMSMAGPPANAVGNIPNALGYFVVAYVSTQSDVAEDLRK